MIKSEFSNLNKQKIFIVIALIMFITPISIQLFFNNFVKIPMYWNYDISEYKNSDEIEQKILELDNMKESLDKSILFYEEKIDLINDSITIYKYLEINNIKYDDVMNFSDYDLVNDTSSLLNVFSLLASMILLLISTMLCGKVINKDFSLGTASFVYGGKSINKRFFAKVFVIHIISFFIVLFFIVCCYVFSNGGNYEYKYLISVHNNGISLFESKELLSKIVLSLFLDYILISLFTLMNSVIVKKTYTFCILQIGGVLITLGTTALMQNTFINAYLLSYIMAFNLGYKGIKYFLIFFSKLIILGIGNFIAFRHFKKRDIY